MGAMDKQFRALADSTRRAILRLLRDGPLTSGVIAESFPSAWATVSRHLAVLREADLVVAQRDGQTIRYELNTTVFQDVLQHLADLVHPSGAPRRRAKGKVQRV